MDLFSRARVGTVAAIDPRRPSAVLLALDDASARGVAPTTAQLATSKTRWMEPQLEDLLTQLRQLRWVHMTRDGGWTLARQLSDATLGELFRSRVFNLPNESDPDWPDDPTLASVLAAANAGLADALDVQLAAFRLRRADTRPVRPETAAR